MPLTKDATVVSQKIIDILDVGLVAIPAPILKAVYYGNQELIPSYPAACVDSGPKRRELLMARRNEITLSSNIMVYHSEIQSTTVTKKEVEEVAEAIENKLHEDNTLDGLVVWGFVTAVDHGIAMRGEVMMRAVRLTWSGISREVFTA